MEAQLTLIWMTWDMRKCRYIRSIAILVRLCSDYAIIFFLFVMVKRLPMQSIQPEFWQDQYMSTHNPVVQYNVVKILL